MIFRYDQNNGLLQRSPSRLALNNNQISSIEPGSFDGMIVGSINLSNNTLGVLQQGTFYGLGLLGDWTFLELDKA